MSQPPEPTGSLQQEQLDPGRFSPVEERGVVPALAERPRTATHAWLGALVGWTLLLSFYHLQGGAYFEPTDCWVAQTAREMLDNDDWIVPRFSGGTRIQKSPGAYWAVMLASKLRGTAVDEVSTRIPNAVASVVIVLMVFWLAKRIAGDRAAVFAGFAAASSTMIVYWSHRGASDLGLAAWITVSLGCFWIGSADAPPGWRRSLLWMSGYLAAGVGMLYKLPMPLVCVGVPAALYVLIQRRWRLLASGWHLLGLLLFCLPWLPWALTIYLTEPTALDKWRVEFLDRFTGNLPTVESHRQWQYYFLYLIPTAVFTLPYTLSLPAAFVRAFRRKPGVSRDGMNFMLLWFLGLLAFFTASAGKETRYFLPALPPLFVMLGAELAVFFDPDRRVRPDLNRAGFLAVWILLPLGLLAGAWGLYRWHEHTQLFEWKEVWPPYAVAAGILGVGAMLAAWLFYHGRRNASFAALVGTMWGMWLWVWPNFMPILVSQLPYRDFAAQLRERIDPSLRPNIYQIAQQDPRISWYSDVRFPRLVDQLELLRMAGGRRSLKRERRIIGEEAIRRLSGTEPVLLVASRGDYELFHVEAPRFLAEQGRAMPRTYLWLQTRVGSKRKQSVLFSNIPPPWPEEPLTPLSDMLLARQALTTAPASRPERTSNP